MFWFCLRFRSIKNYFIVVVVSPLFIVGVVVVWVIAFVYRMVLGAILTIYF
jgi:hypothetical protein